MWSIWGQAFSLTRISPHISPTIYNMGGLTYIVCLAGSNGSRAQFHPHSSLVGTA